VLVYCNADLTVEIRKIVNDSVIVTVTEKIDPAILRSLDQAPYKILTVEGAFGMRGADYRCKAVKMSFVIAKSFINRREAMQGLGRVGRSDDDCKRVKFTDVEMIDTTAETQYTSKLL
jgi:hypothetical protein